MDTPQITQHPYHHTEEKNIVQHVGDWALPIGLLVVYFLFYNFGKITPSEMIKTTGLVAIMLLSITLFIGSISRFFPVFNILKAHRKFWGVSSFVYALVHAGLVLAIYADFDVIGLFTQSSSLLGLIAGLAALGILFIVTVSSIHRIISRLPPGAWKMLQMTSYLALALAVAHFYLVEQVNGVFVIKRLMGQITYWFAFVALIARVVVFVFPKEEIGQ